MTKINTNFIIESLANLSIYLIVLILLISLIIKDNKIIYGLIIFDGLIALVGFLLLITKGKKIRGNKMVEKIKG